MLKEFNCHQCGQYFDLGELDDGRCPDCQTEEDMFLVGDDDFMDEEE